MYDGQNFFKSEYSHFIDYIEYYATNAQWNNLIHAILNYRKISKILYVRNFFFKEE
jgi:hypothetical protein